MNYIYYAGWGKVRECKKEDLEKKEWELGHTWKNRHEVGQICLSVRSVAEDTGRNDI